jgi:hypothetical protein
MKTLSTDQSHMSSMKHVHWPPLHTGTEEAYGRMNVTMAIHEALPYLVCHGSQKPAGLTTAVGI